MLNKKDTKEADLLVEKFKNEKQKYSQDFYLDVRVQKILKMGLNKDESFTPKESVLNTYSWLFAQMESSFDKLYKFPILISSTNKSLEKRDISAADQFIYHIENYFSSVYIFEQRIKKFVSHLQKQGKKSKCNENNLKELKKVQKKISSGLEGVIKIRGLHVHDKSYYDDGFYRLELFDRLGRYRINEEDRRGYKGYTKITLRSQRGKWKNIIRKNNNVCEALLGMLYEPAFKVHEEIYKKTP